MSLISIFSGIVRFKSFKKSDKITLKSTGLYSITCFRLKASRRCTSSRAPFPALIICSNFSRSNSLTLQSYKSSSPYPKIGESRLFKSWAISPVSLPMASTFWVRKSCSSSSFFVFLGPLTLIASNDGCNQKFHIHFLQPHLFIGIFAAIFPFGSYFKGIQQIRPTNASITATLEPLSAGVIATIFLGEVMLPLQKFKNPQRAPV